MVFWFSSPHIDPPTLFITAGALGWEFAIGKVVGGSAVSSIPAMAAVWSLVKPRVFATYLGLGISGAIASGIIFQMGSIYLASH